MLNYPNYYQVQLGDNIYCTVDGAAASCSVISPWTLAVSGPATAIAAKQQFTVIVYGITETIKETASTVYGYIKTDGAEPSEGGSVADVQNT